MDLIVKAVFIGNSKADQRNWVALLQQGGWTVEYDYCCTIDQVNACLLTRSWDVVICSDAIEHIPVLELMCRVRERVSGIPFIVLSNEQAIPNVVELVRAGADDYIVTDQISLLGPAIERVLKNVTLRGKTKTSRAKLAEYQRRLKSMASELSLAEERERRRIAVGVHDNICQKLALAKLELQFLQHSVSDTQVIRAIERECCIIDQIISDAHSLTFELSNPVLYEIGLDAAIKSWLDANIKDKYGLYCEFISRFRGIKPPEDVRVFLFHSVRELVTNIIKHAKASRVKIILEPCGQQLHISVEDNGAGFELANVKISQKGGFGLFSVEERLEYLGGHLDVKSVLGHGTCVMMTVPWENQSTLSKAHS